MSAPDSNDDDAPASPPARRRRRPLRWAFGALVLLIMLIAGGVGWLLNTQPGAQWVAARAVSLLNGKLELGEVRGRILGPLTVSGIRYADEEKGQDVRIAQVSVDVALRELLHRTVHILMLDVNGLDVRLTTVEREEKEPGTLSLDPPAGIDIVLDRFTLKGARITRDDNELFTARTAEAIGSWTDDGIRIGTFAVDSVDGNVRLAGEVDKRGGYTGRVNGSFSWRLSRWQVAGNIDATSADEKLNARLRLSAPFDAQLDASVGQTGQVPWTFTLNVPRFDPRDGLLEGDNLTALAANLRGEGDLTVAEVRGEVEVNRQRARIEPARVRYKEEVLAIEQLTLIDPAGRGTLSAEGDVRFGEAAASAARGAGGQAEPSPAAPAGPDDDSSQGPPFYADLRVRWNGVQLPREWVGQPLATQGELKVLGSLAMFDAGGQLALGPPGKLADIAIDISGTTERVHVKRFEILQPGGSLAAQGDVQLSPAIGWQLNAQARTFDPGALVAGWPGKLGFEFDTRGEMTPRGPNASLNLKDLSGTLRGRPIAGHADLTLNPQKVIAGDLALSSGRSTVLVTGRGGQALDLDTQLQVASLEDWVPMAQGSLQGKFHISGTWPRLAINGAAQGNALAFAGSSVRTVSVTADMRNPLEPAGTINVAASDIVSAGFEISSLQLDASGDEKAHTAHLKTTGQPASVEVRIQGGRDGPDGWAGAVEELNLAVTGIAPLSLRAPANVAFNPREFSVSESCLQGDQISACIAAEQNEARELNAKYTLEHLPLGLIAALAAPEMPFQVEAVIEGNGNIRRTPEGALFGQAEITSASGRISEAGASAQEEAADALLSYEGLAMRAQLEGESANATLQLGFTGGGNLAGEVQVGELLSASPTVDGKATLTIADLSPVGLFVPQLADVHGSGEANVQVTGTVTAPNITGNAHFRALSAEVPQVGIKLQEGELQAELSPGRDITLSGQLKSGDGVVRFTGETTQQNVLSVKVQGKDFLAANIPGARVVIAPDLQFERSGKLMTLGGTVAVPRADIDLPKLPRQGSATQASPDVVVIDDEHATEQARAVPLEVRVTAIVGPDVTLVGYGLDAKVEGQIIVTELPNQPTTGSGEIRLTGTYKAYGQDLTIQQGRLLYAGQPLTDPQLNIVATRTIESDNVTAKLTVTGSAQRPRLEISADPAMTQSQALSYLVTGKPLNQVGSGESDLVQAAARSLGGAAGNLLAQGIGRRLGISDIGVTDNEELGGSAFTVGQYLSPRLYLSYGVGLFEPGQVVTVRYRVNDRISIEASQGPQNQKAGINYRVER